MSRFLIAVLVASLAGLPGSAQEKVVTSSGKTLIIYPNGTWKEEKSHIPLEKNNDILRPKTSTAKASILKGRATIYYNPIKWKLKGGEEGGRSNFVHADGDAQAMIITERIQMPIETLEKVALENARAAAPDAVVSHREKKRVNGLDVVELHIKGSVQNTPFYYMNYYYSCEKGIIQAITYTSQNLFNEYKADFVDFLNGLTMEPYN